MKKVTTIMLSLLLTVNLFSQTFSTHDYFVGKEDNTDSIGVLYVAPEGFMKFVALRLKRTEYMNFLCHTFNFDSIQGRNDGNISDRLAWVTSSGSLKFSTTASLPINSSQITTGLGFTPISQSGARTSISLTTTGTSGASSYNSSTGVLNVPNYASSCGTVTSVGITSTDFSISGSPITVSGNITANLTTTGITAGDYGIVNVDTKGRILSGKRSEIFSGTSNSSGIYTVTFGTSYSVAPNIQASITNQSSTDQFIRISSISTTGFTINVFQRSPVTILGISLLPGSVTNVNGASIDVVVIEK